MEEDGVGVVEMVLLIKNTVLFVKFIQLFFCVLKCHNRNSCLYTGSDYNRFLYYCQFRSLAFSA